MSLITYSYFDPTSTDIPVSKTSYPAIPAWNAELDTTSGHTDNFFFRSVDGNAATWIYKPYGSNNATVGAIDYTQNPTNKEFWGRFVWKSPAAPRTNMPDLYVLMEFWNYNGTRWKIISDIGIKDNVIYQRIYNTVEGNNDVVTTNTILVGLSGITQDASIGCKVLDIRCVLDTVAGYIQLYNYSATRITEFLGTTTNTLAATHIATYNMCQYSDWYPVFSISADESTMGMFVVPLLAKAEGKEQDQDSGGVYTSFAKRMSQPGNFGTVSLTAPKGVSKSYTFKPKSMADISLPANYIVKEMKLSGVFEAQSTASNPVPLNLRLRKPSTNATIAKPVDPVYPNVTSSVNKLHQVRHARFKTNPISGAAWTVTDFADIEFGFGFTGE